MHRLTRSWLQERDLDLAGRLERCWRNAFNEWLPAVNHIQGSYNSFPHLRNLEMHLDEILFAIHPDAPGRKVIEVLELTAPEVYVMLCSILFHDLGKSYKSEKKLSHACESRRTLARHYRALGLETEEIALCIGRICHYHDPDEDTDKKAEILSSSGIDPRPVPVVLRDVTITGYGVIREDILGALLVLVDHLDGTFNRVLPHYVRTDDFGDIGRFRSQIPGIRVDLSARMAVTAIRPFVPIPTPGPRNAEKHDVTLRLNDKSPFMKKGEEIKEGVLITFRADELLKCGDVDVVRGASSMVESLKSAEAGNIKKTIEDFKDELDKLKNYSLRQSCDINLQKLLQSAGKLKSSVNKRIHDADGAATSGVSVYNLTPSADGKESTSWSIPSLLIAANMAFLEGKFASPEQSQIFLHATVAGNTRENAHALDQISDTLRAYRIPVRAWLLECDEHLYTWFGAETYEPLLTDDFLKRLAQAMWNKSTKVFGRGASTYEGLASDLREESTSRIRMGVRRLSILSRNQENKELIRALQDGWDWKTKSYSLCDLMKKIRKLERPSRLDIV